MPDAALSMGIDTGSGRRPMSFVAYGSQPYRTRPSRGP
jgi:hypothetical protein